MDKTEQPKPKIFISYSHEDEEWKDLVKQYFRITDFFQSWDDRDIPLGKEWLDEINKEINSCQIVLFLISANFLDSDFIKKSEVPKFLERYADKKLKIVPIMLSPCPWKQVKWLEAFQGYPDDYYPLASFQEVKHIRFQECEKIQGQLTDLVYRVIDEYEKELKTPDLTNFIISNSINEEELKNISKQFLENDIYRRKLKDKTKIREIIDYLDNMTINDKQPLPCIINHIYKEKNLDNKKIKEWLEKNYHSTICNQIKLNTEKSMQKVQLPTTNRDDSIFNENRKVIEFELVSQNNCLVYIRSFTDGRFDGNNDPVYKEVNIKDDKDIEKFKLKLLNKVYSDLHGYKHLDFILPKELILLDIKQWSFEDEINDIYKSFINEGGVSINVHIRENVHLSNTLDSLWEGTSQQLDFTIENSMKDMLSPKDKVSPKGKDNSTTEAGLNYRFLPTLWENFYDRAKMKSIVLRCTNSSPERLKDFNNWLDKNKEKLTLKELKKEVDKPENSYMTIIWSDPKIPLISKGI